MINLNDNQYVGISKEELLKKFTEQEIFRHYIGDFDLGQVYKSPLRRGDDTPSFNVFYSKRHDCLLFKDFAGKRGDFVRLVQELQGIATYQEALQQIAKDMSTPHSISVQPKKTLPMTKIECDIKIKERQWEDRDTKYWLQYGITYSTIQLFNVIPIAGYFHNNMYIPTHSIAYAYLEYKDHVLTYKIYRPTAGKRSKWRNNNPYGVHQGYRQLPDNGKLLIITKSLKDVMSLYEVVGQPAIGVQSETCFIKETVIDEYKFRFKRVFTLFDNDRQGTEQAKSYQEMYNISPIFIPEHYEVKDFSDLVKKVGKDNATTIFKYLL